MSHHNPTDPIRFQCRHIFTDGRRCKNPTLRSPRSPENPEGHENFCYFHHTTRRPIEDPKSRRSRRSTFTLPSPCELTERTGIQLAIGQVLQKIASNDIDPRRAGLLLYGLQIASLNLKQDRRNGLSPANQQNEDLDETDTVDEITVDPLLGPLAPPAELHSTEPKGSAQRLLEEFDRRDAEFDRRDAELCGDDDEANEDSNLPTLHAVADPTPPHHPRTTPIYQQRTTPIYYPLKNLRKRHPGGAAPNPAALTAPAI